MRTMEGGSTSGVRALLVAVLGFSAATVIGAEPPATVKPTADSERGVPESLGESGEKAPPPDAAELARNLWWNQERVVAELGLSQKQREAMNQLFADYLEQRRSVRAPQSATEDPFRVALAAADLEAAERAIAERGERLAAEATASQRMMISILALLSEGQLATVREKIPKVLGGRWFIQSGPRRPRASNAAGLRQRELERARNRQLQQARPGDKQSGDAAAPSATRVPRVSPPNVDPPRNPTPGGGGRD